MNYWRRFVEDFNNLKKIDGEVSSSGVRSGMEIKQIIFLMRFYLLKENTIRLAFIINLEQNGEYQEYLNIRYDFLFVSHPNLQILL